MDNFKRLLKRFFSQRIMQLAHWMCHDDALYKFTFYLLTYLHLLGLQVYNSLFQT